jgi:hypothetical protein
MMALFKAEYESQFNNIFNNDIKCVCHVFNIIVNNILNTLLNVIPDDESPCKCFFIVFNNYIIILTNIYLALIIRIRRLVNLTKYTKRIKALFHQGINNCKQNSTLPRDFNQKVIPIGMLLKFNNNNYF